MNASRLRSLGRSRAAASSRVARDRARASFLACALLAACSGAAFARAGDTPAPAVAPTPRIAVDLAPAVTRAEIEAHVRFLAADEQKGRVTGTPEAEACARYLAEVMKRAGLEPAGDDGTFLQRVPIVRTTFTAVPALTFLDGKGETLGLVHGQDFSRLAGTGAARELPLRTVRAAADLPERGDPGLALFVDASTADRKAWFAGAKLAPEAFGLVLVPGSKESGRPRTSVPSRGSFERGSPTADEPGLARVHGAALDRLREGRAARVTWAPNATRVAMPASNVVGLVRGRGTPERPDLAREAVVVTAHYDHIDHEHVGASAAGEDQVWNGADDDASGTAAVLELAGAIAHGPAPARTVVFALVTGEEVGLLGTEEYLERPVVPLARTVANLNVEMIGRPDEKAGGPGKLWFTGYELTNLGPAFTEKGLAIVADPYPDQQFFLRSDNIAFVKRGVVGQTLSSYNLHRDYHKPSDEADTLDFAHLTTATEAALAAVRLVASGAIDPAWTSGRAPDVR